MNKGSKLTVLLVEHERLLRLGLRALLGNTDDLEVIGESENGLDAVHKAQALKPEVTLMDVRLPYLPGIQVTERLCKSASPTRVILLADTEQAEEVLQAIQVGAQGYLLRNADEAELLYSLRAVGYGYFYLHPPITKHIIERLCSLEALASQRPKDGQLAESLTQREQSVLQLLCLGKSTTQIAETLHITEGTVRNHISNILCKLQATDRTQAVLYALQHQLISM